MLRIGFMYRLTIFWQREEDNSVFADKLIVEGKLPPDFEAYFCKNSQEMLVGSFSGETGIFL